MENITKTQGEGEVQTKSEPNDRRLKKLIKKIKEILQSTNITPQQYRYIVKRIREDLNLKISTRPKKLPEYLTPPEIYGVIKTAYNISSKHGVLTELLIFTGLRIREARNLDIRDIQNQDNTIKVVRGKGKKDRYVPVTDNLLQKIRMYVKNRKAGYLFLSRKNQAYSVRMLQKIIKAVYNLSNLEKAKRLTTHSLRHTYACLCLSKGMRIEDIKLLLGHTSIKTTEIYARLELGEVKQKYLEIMTKY